MVSKQQRKQLRRKARRCGGNSTAAHELERVEKREGKLARRLSRRRAKRKDMQ